MSYGQSFLLPRYVGQYAIGNGKGVITKTRPAGQPQTSTVIGGK